MHLPRSLKWISGGVLLAGLLSACFDGEDTTTEEDRQASQQAALVATD